MRIRGLRVAATSWSFILLLTYGSPLFGITHLQDPPESTSAVEVEPPEPSQDIEVVDPTPKDNGPAPIAATVTALGPNMSRTRDVAIQYEVRNPGAFSLESVSLYIRPEGADQWRLEGADPDLRSPVSFSASDGRYGIYITCATGGAVQAVPLPETPPQLVLTIDTTDPVLELIPMERSMVRSGSIMRIAWKFSEINHTHLDHSFKASRCGTKSPPFAESINTCAKLWHVYAGEDSLESAPRGIRFLRNEPFSSTCAA